MTTKIQSQFSALKKQMININLFSADDDLNDQFMTFIDTITCENKTENLKNS
jgi:hypothetical protein